MTIARYFPPRGENIDKLCPPPASRRTSGAFSRSKGYEVKLTKDEQRDLAEAFRDREIIPRRTCRRRTRSRRSRTGRCGPRRPEDAVEALTEAKK